MIRGLGNQGLFQDVTNLISESQEEPLAMPIFETGFERVYRIVEYHDFARLKNTDFGLDTAKYFDLICVIFDLLSSSQKGEGTGFLKSIYRKDVSPHTLKPNRVLKYLVGNVLTWISFSLWSLFSKT